MRRHLICVVIPAVCVALGLALGGCAQEAEKPKPSDQPVIIELAVSKPAPIKPVAMKPLLTPAKEPAPAAKPTVVAGSYALPPAGDQRYVYTVVKGDTDFKVISRKVYKHASTAPLIGLANPKVKEAELKPGMKLTIPVIKYKGQTEIKPAGCKLMKP